MAFREYWSILIKRWYLVLICLILVGSSVLLVSLMIPPIYRSTTIIQVVIHSGGNQSDINELLASNQLVQTESQLATSDPILQDVVVHHPQITVSQLENMVSSEPKLNTQLFELHVQDGDARQAANLTNEIAKAFIEHQEKARQQEDMADQQQLQQEITTTQNQMQVTKSQLSAAHGQSVDNLEAQLTMLQQHNSQWQSALAQLELTEAQSGNFLLIVQPALPETDPVEPKVLLNTSAGFVVGLLFGLLLILVVEQVDPHVGTAMVIRQIVDWPVLSIVWRSREPENEHITNPIVRSINMEAYRMLRSNIGFAEVDKPLRSLLVTSTLPSEGKSTIAINLAICMAMAGKSTLLIDADLRCPVLHDKFGLAADKPGLSNAILSCGMSGFQVSSLLCTHQAIVDAKVISLENYMYMVGVPHLRVMPSGPLPPDPSELFDSSAMQRFFQALSRSGAEVIIFDASSLLELSDAITLSSKVDGTIMVIDPKRVCKQQLKQVQVNLTQVGAHVVGYVMNKQRRYSRLVPPSYYSHYRSVERMRGAELGEFPNMTL